MFLIKIALLLLFLAFPTTFSKSTETGTQIFSSGTDKLSKEHEIIAQAQVTLRKKSKEGFLKSGNIAKFLGLAPISGIHMPVPVNIIFLGFNGDGKGAIKIPIEEIQSWMEHLDHIVHHTRVPVSKLSCKEDGHCSSIHSTTSKLMTLPSNIHMNISVHVIEVDPEVHFMFERALHAFSRPMIVNQVSGSYQVDIGSMESMINGFLTELGISWSNTIIIANPKNKPHDADYAYRLGLSKQEIDNLVTDKDLISNLEEILAHKAAFGKDMPGEEYNSGRWKNVRPKGKFEINSIKYESSQWVKKIDSYFNERESFMKNFDSKLVNVDNNKISKELLLIKSPDNKPVFPNLLGDLKKENGKQRSDIKGLNNLRVLEPEEGCLTDTWIGSKKWVYIDLSAMNIIWGPHTGGDGVKSETSLPMIDKIFAQKANAQNEHQNTELSKLIQQEVTSKMEDFKKTNTYKGTVVGAVTSEALLETEIDIYEDFAQSFCQGVKNPPDICLKVKEKVSLLLQELEVIKSSPDTKYDLKRYYPWELFGMMEEEDTEEDRDDNTRMKDLFMAHISSVVSKVIRHIFVPPSITWTQDGHSIESNVPFTIDVTFRINLVSDPTLEVNLFDIDRYRNEILKLKLKQQKFRFIVQRTKLIEDSFLSGIISSAQHSLILQKVDNTGSLREERVYFDSEELSRRLHANFAKEKNDRNVGHHTDNSTYLDIPIFILSLDRDTPVFIDKYYTAKALSEMVLVVHNAQVRGPNPMGIVCNRHMIGSTISSSLKSAVAATMQHLGGILPPHLGYSPSHKAVTHDWMWNVGSNPFSLTSPGYQITEAQRDTMHRNYVLDAIDKSIEAINGGIESLQEETVGEQSWEYAIKEWSKLYTLLSTLTMLVEIWRRAVTEAGMLNFDNIADSIQQIRDKTDQFNNLVTQIKEGFNPLACKPKTTRIMNLPWISDEAAGIIILIVVALLVYRFFPRKKKSKKF